MHLAQVGFFLTSGFKLSTLPLFGIPCSLCFSTQSYPPMHAHEFVSGGPNSVSINSERAGPCLSMLPTS